MRKLGVTRRANWPGSGRPVARRSSSTQLPLPPALQLLADPATFVGRQSERDRLRDLWRQANGQLRVAVVVGEAGMGKSRITAEFALEVQQDGGQVRLGACFEDLGVPYEPFVQIIGADAARSATVHWLSAPYRSPGAGPGGARLATRLGVSRTIDVGRWPVRAGHAPVGAARTTGRDGGRGPAARRRSRTCTGRRRRPVTLSVTSVASARPCRCWSW